MGNQHSELRDRPQQRKRMVMDRLRKSLRKSFRRKDGHVPECSKPHLWQADEAAVRAGTCSFSVKYLGCIEVYESRGMQVCEDAFRVLNNSRKHMSMVKGTLYITGDGLRVVDDDTKGLLVDQTIEKVSFCAPDRNVEKGFSYICRDGTTRRWMCHGFLAIKDSGERLSHAVGCAFAVCLERKQRRDKETVTFNYDPQNATFTRTGSFRQGSLIDRLQDPQDCKMSDPPPVKQVHNPYAIERPHAPPTMLQRQNSFKGFSSLNQASPFKRQLSLRISDLPSNVERQRSMSLGSSDMLMQPNGIKVTPIPESSPLIDHQDTISTMCQQLSQGLSFLSSSDDPFISGLSQPPTTDEGTTRADAWLASSTNIVKRNSLNRTISVPNPSSTVSAIPGSNHGDNFTGLTSATKPSSSEAMAVLPQRRNSPNFSHLRSHSLGSADSFLAQLTQPTTNESNSKLADDSKSSATGPFDDPFNVEWAELDHRHKPNTNPFLESSVKAFEIQM